MPVVSNTSPLLNLAIIGLLDLVREQFTEVLVPPAVLTELRLDEDLPGVSSIRQAIQQGWLQVIGLEQEHLFRALNAELDEGEAAAIALALERRLTQILMDESEGRAKARALGLSPIGILGILLKAKQQGKLKSVDSAMNQLVDQAGFFISDELRKQILASAQE